MHLIRHKKKLLQRRARKLWRRATKEDSTGTRGAALAKKELGS